jgi:hypothetical protein
VPFVNVNFADVESFEPLPPGKYDVEIDKIEVRENKAGDALYLNWELIVIDGEYENRRLWMMTSLKETALFRLKQVLEDLDILDDDDEVELEYDDDVEPTSSAGPRLVYPELEGVDAIATVKNEMYDGRERNRVEMLTSAATKKKSSSKSKRKRDEDDEEEAPRSSRRGNGGRRSSSRRRVR